MIKQQIIEFSDGYFNCDLSPEDYGKKFELTEYETISILRLAKIFRVEHRWVLDKELIERVLRAKNIIAIELAEMIGVNHTVISNVINLRRGIPKKNRAMLENMLYNTK